MGIYISDSNGNLRNYSGNIYTGADKRIVSTDLYDANSTDSSINKGFTSGLVVNDSVALIQSDNANYSKYFAFIIYASSNNGSTNSKIIQTPNPEFNSETAIGFTISILSEYFETDELNISFISGYLQEFIPSGSQYTQILLTVTNSGNFYNGTIDTSDDNVIYKVQGLKFE